jgi:hypothetical protein
MIRAAISHIKGHFTHYFGSIEERDADIRRQISEADMERAIGVAAMISGREMSNSTYEYVLHLHRKGRMT